MIKDDNDHCSLNIGILCVLKMWMILHCDIDITYQTFKYDSPVLQATVICPIKYLKNKNY